MECAKVVEQEIAFYGAENVGTMLGETMIGTGGVIPPPPEYWPLVCETCKAQRRARGERRGDHRLRALRARGSVFSSSAPIPT